MHPILFEIPFFGGIKIYSYGVMAAIGFLSAIFWIKYQSKKVGLPGAKMVDLAFLMMVTAMAGARAAFVIAEWDYFSSHIGEIFQVWEGGLIFYGGLLSCVLVAVIYLKKLRLNFWKVADVFMPGVALGHAFGRIGCYLAGCCYGRPCDVNAWYGTVFPPHVHSLAPMGVPLYPTQWIQSLAEFLNFFLLAWVSRKKGFDGQILFLYVITYSLLRILVEFLREDSNRDFVIPHLLSAAQLIGAVLILAAMFGILYFRRRRL